MWCNLTARLALVEHYVLTTVLTMTGSCVVLAQGQAISLKEFLLSWEDKEEKQVCMTMDKCW